MICWRSGSQWQLQWCQPHPAPSTKIQSIPSAFLIPIDVGSPYTANANPVPSITLTWPFAYCQSINQSKLSCLLDHNHCEVKQVAMTQSTSILPPTTSSPSTGTTITTNVNALTPHLDACHVMTNAPHTPLDANTSINNILQQQLQTLQKIKEMIEAVFELMDLLFYALTTPNPCHPKPCAAYTSLHHPASIAANLAFSTLTPISAPTIHWKSCLSDPFPTTSFHKPNNPHGLLLKMANPCTWLLPRNPFLKWKWLWPWPNLLLFAAVKPCLWPRNISTHPN